VRFIAFMVMNTQSMMRITVHQSLSMSIL